MHELSIANAILEAAQNEAAKHPGVRVTKVGVRIGSLAGVDPDALSFGFDALKKETELAAAGLGIGFVPRRPRGPHSRSWAAVGRRCRRAAAR